MNYKDKIDILEVAEFIAECGSGTRVYLGCDSERYRHNDIWYADYILVVVVHKNAKHGCKIFGSVVRERDYEQRTDRPRMRLMTEAIKAAELFLDLQPLVDQTIEVHLDINPNEEHNSSIVINEAVGYIRAMCNVIPLVKPNAFAASYAADRYKEVIGHRRVA
jgi:predicted RNase H-related nuclease YkuK (DUF458 family)